MSAVSLVSTDIATPGQDTRDTLVMGDTVNMKFRSYILIYWFTALCYCLSGLSLMVFHESTNRQVEDLYS